MQVRTDGAELCVDSIGDPADPCLLLMMGTGGSLDRWEDGFCERLAAAGRHVVRYDNRDTGASTTWPPGRPGYTGDDLVADAVAILDALGIDRAHVAGISMGAALAQRLTVWHPERVRSLALLSTSPAADGGPDLPPPAEALRASFAVERPEPDWSDREETIEWLLEDERLYAGSRGIDEDALRALLSRVLDRSPRPASAANHALLGGSGMAFERLAEIAVPVLVIHGTADPLFPPDHGAALAQAIPGARLLLIDDLGHELPRWAWDEIVPALIANSAG